MFERMSQSRSNVEQNTNTQFNPQPQKITPEFLKICLEQVEFQSKPFTTLEEDLERQLLDDLDTRQYAKRMVELIFKEKRSISEKKELDLLTDPTTRPYAKRIVELDAIQKKTFLQQLEADLLASPKFRPFHDEFLLLTQKFLTQSLNSREEARACFLVLNPYSIFRAHEILALESLPELNSDQVHDLLKNYLIRIAEVPEKSVKLLNAHTYLENVNFKSGKLIDKHTNMPSKSIARYFSIKEAFTGAAQNLTDKFYRQLINIQVRNSFLSSSGVPVNSAEQVIKRNQILQNIMGSGNIQALMKQTESLLTLGFAKVFFDFDTGFSEKALSILVSHLSQEISNNNFNMSVKKFPEFYSGLQASLNKIDVPDDTPAPAPRYYFP